MFKTTIAIFLFFFTFLNAQTSYDIIDKSENSYKGKSSEGTFTMVVHTPDYTRTVKMKAFNVGNDKALITVLSPLKEQGNKTLKIGNEMWTYLKSTETTMKLPPSMLLQSWNGSDLTNDDLVRETKLTRDYELKILLEEQIASEMCWKVQLTPKPETAVVWGKIYYWVRKIDFMPALIQFYDEKGKLIRTMSFSDIKKMSGRVIPTKWTIESKTKLNHFTEFIYDAVKFDVNIPDKIFSFSELEK